MTNNTPPGVSAVTSVAERIDALREELAVPVNTLAGAAGMDPAHLAAVLDGTAPLVDRDAAGLLLALADETRLRTHRSAPVFV